MENKELNQSLLAARLEFEPVYKDSKGNRAKYAKLPAWLDMVVPILAKHKIRFEQPTVFEGGFVLLKTRLIHTLTGQFTESIFPLDVGEIKTHEQKEHKEGGIQTFHRRYQLMTLLGLCGEDDDNDGYEAKYKAVDAPKTESLSRPGLASEAQVKYLSQLLMGKDNIKKALLDDSKVESLNQLSFDVVSRSITKLTGK